MLSIDERLPRGLWQVLAFAKDLPSRSTAHAAPLAQADDSAAFEALFVRFERQIVAYLCRMLGDEQAALDLSQETFFRA